MPYVSGIGFNGTTTGAEAAQAAAPTAETLRRRALAALVAYGPMTADEIAEKLGEPILSVRPRVSELRASGSVEPTNTRRPTAAGNSAQVWRVTNSAKEIA